MEIFGVGPLEFILILVLALIILGPEDMVGTARKLGQWVYRFVRSPTWRSIMATSQDLRELPTKIVREAGLEDTIKEIKDTADEVKTDLNDTTREINTEMQAATSEVNREMKTAAQDVNEGMKEASAEAQIAMQSTAAGLAGSENTIAPSRTQAQTTAQAAEATPEGAAPTLEVVHQLSPYEVQLGAIATGLGGKEIQGSEPAENTIFRVTPAQNAVPAARIELPSAPELTKQPYAARLEMFAQALGATTGSAQPTESTALEEQAPAEAEPAPAPRAVGIPVGLELNSGGGMDALIKKRMEKMAKSIEELDAKIASAASGEGAPTSPPTEEGAPASTQAAPQENDAEPAAPPARTRRNAKRPAPAEEAPEGEAPKAAPRKRAAKKTLSTAETGDGKNTKPAPRKRASKVTPPEAETTAESAPEAAPRKRTAKTKPTETSASDTPSTQA